MCKFDESKMNIIEKENEELKFKVEFLRLENMYFTYRYDKIVKENKDLNSKIEILINEKTELKLKIYKYT